MKSVVIFLLCATVTLRALAAPAEEALVQEVKEEPKPKEAEKKLAPLVPGARSQLCLPGWEFHGDSCYYLNNDYLSWKEAARYCANYEATLASVHSPKENNHLQNMAGNAKHTFGWTGGIHFEGDWRWQDGTGFDFKLFQSNMGPTSEYKCLRFQSQANLRWYNADCNQPAPSICKIKVNC